MQRTILLAGVLPFVSALLGVVAAWNVLAPRTAEAQEARLRAQLVSVTGAGTERIRLETKWEGQGSEVTLFAPDGTARLIMGSGGIAVPDPAGSGFNIVAEDGTQVARFGTGHGPLGNLPLTTQMFLNDLSGQTRIRLAVGEDGTPRILIYDAEGSVVWAAPE